MMPLIRWGKLPLDPLTRDALQREFENIYRLIPPFDPTVNGTFTSNDTPAKTITVTNGIITKVE